MYGYVFGHFYHLPFKFFISYRFILKKLNAESCGLIASQLLLCFQLLFPEALNDEIALQL